MDFSHSKIQTYLTCPKSYKHYYISRMKLRKKPNYFVLGEAVHKFIDFYYKTKDEKLANIQIDNVFKAVDPSLLSPEEIHRLECDKQIAKGICEVYPSYYKQDFDEFKTFLTEQQFRFELPSKMKNTYNGFIDVLVQDQANDWWVLETKTATVLDADYFERVKIDSQVAGYMWGAYHILKIMPRGVIYNVIKKPAIRLKAGESFAAFQKRIFLEYTKFSKEKGYFNREQLIIGEPQLMRWLTNTDNVADSIAVKEDSSCWPMNTGACLAKWGACPYMAACVTGSYNRIQYMKDERVK